MVMFRLRQQLLLGLGAAFPLLFAYEESIILVPSTPLRGSKDSQHGSSVSLSWDGTVLAVGAPGYNDMDGGMWVYRYNGSAWVEMAGMPLSASGDPEHFLGASVHLSSDGTMLAVGAPYYNEHAGGTWVFRYSGGAWAEMAGMPVCDKDAPSYSSQGTSVSLSSDGTWLAVGGPGYHNDLGAIWVYRYDGSALAVMPGMPLADTSAARCMGQGASVDLSSDGTVLAVSAWSEDEQQGGVWAYRYDGGSLWAEMPGMPSCREGGKGGTRQGPSVSLSRDGTLLAVGGTDNHAWRTWSYQYDGSGWAAMPGMSLSGRANPYEINVRLSSDGNVLAVGVPADLHVGVTWVYRLNGSAYVEMPGMPLPPLSRSEHGSVVSLSSDGTVLVVGEPAVGDADCYGSTWVYATAVGCGPGTYLASGSLPVECTPAPRGRQLRLGLHHELLGLPGRQLLQRPGGVGLPAVPRRHLRPGHRRRVVPVMPARLLHHRHRGRFVLAVPGGDLLHDAAGVRGLPGVRARRRGERRLHEDGGVVRCLRGGAGLCLVVLALVARRRKVAATWARQRARREQARRDRIAGQQLEALLAVHGVKDPDALRAVQVGGPAS
jgi:hypothetical protein